jgi:hypothetical protein
LRVKVKTKKGKQETRRTIQGLVAAFARTRVNRDAARTRAECGYGFIEAPTFEKMQAHYVAVSFWAANRSCGMWRKTHRPEVRLLRSG